VTPRPGRSWAGSAEPEPAAPAEEPVGASAAEAAAGSPAGGAAQVVALAAAVPVGGAAATAPIAIPEGTAAVGRSPEADLATAPDSGWSTGRIAASPAGVAVWSVSSRPLLRPVRAVGPAGVACYLAVAVVRAIRVVSGCSCALPRGRGQMYLVAYILYYVKSILSIASTEVI
jgi:hypothetical protein